MSLRQRLIRWGPWCGILAPGIDFIVNGSLAASHPGYNPLDQYISDLGAPDMSYAGLLRGWWIAFPFLFAPFLLSMRAELPRGWRGQVMLMLLLLFSLGIGGCGVFHCDPGCRGKTFSSHAHFISSDIAAASLALGVLWMQWLAWTDEHWRDFRWINTLFLILGWGAGIALFLAEIKVLPAGGLCERLFYGIFYLWIVFLALHHHAFGRFSVRRWQRAWGGGHLDFHQSAGHR